VIADSFRSLGSGLITRQKRLVFNKARVSISNHLRVWTRHLRTVTDSVTLH
jgi:hypothetical protein